MKNILCKWPLVIVILAGCATSPVKYVPPPSLNRLEVLKKALLSKESEKIAQNESEELARDYLFALAAEKDGHQKRACHLFSNLSENKNFPLKEAAVIHVLSVCDLSKSDLKDIWTKTVIPNYLKEAYAEQSLKLAILKNLPVFEAQFSIDLVPSRPVQALKVKLIKRAIAIAEMLKDQSNVKLYTDRLKEVSPLYNTDITDENIYLIAKDFEVNRKFEIARSMYEKIISGDFDIDEKVKAYNSYRTSFKVERNLKKFLQETYKMEEFLKKEMENNPEDQTITEHWAATKILLAKAVWTNHQNSEARSIIGNLIESSLGNNNQKANAQFIYGSLHMELKENAEALKRFEKAGAYTVTDAALSENIQWAIVWNKYLQKKYKEVVSDVEKFVKKSNNQNFTAKLNYWMAKSLLRLDKKAKANEIFSAINAADPFGYYGIISTIDLNTPLTPIPPPATNTDSTGNLTLDWLIAMEEKSLAQKYLKTIDSQFKSVKDRERAMSLYAQTEWYQGGMRQIYNFKMSTRNAKTEKYINVVFPTPYLSIAEKLGAKYSVPKELILAIARQESAFVASERSWADAFGLMQLIPEKALELSKKYKIPYHDYNDLYNPETNLELGTALLKDLREKFNYKFVQTVASYNASQNVIALWEKERFNGNYFEFVEMIPYEETRNYIKLVFRNYITYKRITEKKEFQITKNFFAQPFN